MGVAILIFLYNMIKSWRSGPRVGDDPGGGAAPDGETPLGPAPAENARWGGDTLEWYTASPPPPDNFDRLPPITSARPLRDLRLRLARQGRPRTAPRRGPPSSPSP